MGQAFAKLLQRSFPVLRYPSSLNHPNVQVPHHIWFCCHKIISQLNQNWKFSIHSEWELIKVMLSTGNKKRFSVSETRHCRFLPFTFLLEQGTHCCRRSRRGRPSRSRCWRARGWRRSCSCWRKALKSRWSKTFYHFAEKESSANQGDLERFIVSQKKTQGVGEWEPGSSSSAWKPQGTTFTGFTK